MLSYNDILRTDGLNAVTFSDPYAKLCFTTMIVRALISSPVDTQTMMHKRVLYIDTDTAFSAYLAAGLILKDHEASRDTKSAASVPDSNQTDRTNNIIYTQKDGSNNDNDDGVNYSNNNEDKDKRLVQVFLPSEGRFESLLGEAIAYMSEASAVIFDSLNSFYNMYPLSYPVSGLVKQPSIKKHKNKKNSDEKKESDATYGKSRADTPSLQKAEGKGNPRYTIGRLNHLLSIFIMLLVKHGIYHNIPVLVTSMVRYKKISEGLWTKSPACGRLLNQKSVVKISVEMSNEKDLSVNVMKHPMIGQQTIVFADAGIYSAFEI